MSPSFTRPIATPATGAFIGTPASINARLEPHTEAIELDQLGPELEHHGLFPERANIGVAQVTGPDRLRLRVWERGVGLTKACGSGACAAAVAACRRGLTGRRVQVMLDGGPLELQWREDGHVVMTGPVATAFTGTLGLELLP